MTDGPRKSAPYHHGNLRDSLVLAGLELLEREGLAGLSLRATARLAGVSQAAPYHHFKNKDELLVAIGVAGFDKIAELQQHTWAQHADPEARLQAMAALYVETAQAFPELFRLMTAGALRDAGDRPELRRALDESLAIFERAVGAWLDAEGLDGVVPAVATTGAWALVHGLSHLALLAPVLPSHAPLPPSPALVGRLISAFLAGLRSSR